MERPSVEKKPQKPERAAKEDSDAREMRSAIVSAAKTDADSIT
jgi:hypothetical protein